MHFHFLLLQKWPQSPWIDSQANDIGKWKEPWLSHIAYRSHLFRFRHPYLHWTGIFDLLWDSPNVPFMGHCLWSQSHFIHDFRLHANVLHIHAFQDQHQQKQSKVLLKWMIGRPQSMICFTTIAQWWFLRRSYSLTFYFSKASCVIRTLNSSFRNFESFSVENLRIEIMPSWLKMGWYKKLKDFKKYQ